MAWIRLDDKRALNLKLTAAGFAARGLDEAAICLSGNLETDGKITRSMLAGLAASHGTPNRVALGLAKILVDVGRWEPVDDGWMIHDYLEYNPSRAESQGHQEQIRKVRQAAGSTGGLRSGETRRRSKHEANETQVASSKHEANESEATKPRPVPSRKNQIPAVGVTHDDCPQPVEKRDLETERPTAPTDPLLVQLEAVCSGKSRPTVRAEAVQVLGWALGHVDRRLVEESIGYAGTLAELPVLPRAVASIVERRAGDNGIQIPPFAPAGRTLNAL